MGIVRHAVLSDVDHILKVFQNGFDPVLLPYTIVGCNGIKEFISDQIEFHSLRTDVLFVVYEEANNILGAAEFRRSVDRLFLNHIYVLSEVRSNGVGRRLLRDGIVLACDGGQKILDLDVSSNNHKAKHWYLSIGLKPVQEKSWIEMCIPEPIANVEYWWIIKGFGEANRFHNIYGFSQFSVYTQIANHTVGRLGLSYFRSTDFAILQDQAALYALQSIDQNRRLLLLGTLETTINDNLEYDVLATSLRLTGNIDEVLISLGKTPSQERS